MNNRTIFRLGRPAASVLLALMLAGPASAQEPAHGQAKARDGWTIAIGGVRVRLAGLVAPTEGRRCGAVDCVDAAAARLSELVDGHEITCGRDRRLGHGVYQGACRLEDGADPALTLLSEGLAEIAPDAPEPYRAASEAAQAAGLGRFGS